MLSRFATLSLRIERSRNVPGSNLNILAFAEVGAVVMGSSTNVLAGAVATSSSATSAVQNAMDGDASTAFVSADADLAWAEFTLPTRAQLSIIAITPAADPAQLAGAVVQVISADREVLAAWRVPAGTGAPPGGQPLYLHAGEACLNVEDAFEDFRARNGKAYA